MQTITIELLNDKALSLLQQLEKLNILRLISPPEQADSASTHRQWAGSISKETGKKMLEYTTQSRDEWERNI